MTNAVLKAPSHKELLAHPFVIFMQSILLLIYGIFGIQVPLALIEVTSLPSHCENRHQSVLCKAGAESMLADSTASFLDSARQLLSQTQQHPLFYITHPQLCASSHRYADWLRHALPSATAVHYLFKGVRHKPMLNPEILQSFHKWFHLLHSQSPLCTSNTEWQDAYPSSADGEPPYCSALTGVKEPILHPFVYHTDYICLAHPSINQIHMHNNQPIPTHLGYQTVSENQGAQGMLAGVLAPPLSSWSSMLMSS